MPTPNSNRDPHVAIGLAPERLVLLTGLVLSLSACGGEELPDGPRVTVVPVKGQVLVDGKPAADAAVRLIPIGEKPQDLPTSSDFTDNEGRFEISTFESGDGAPPGEYKLTLVWGQRNLMNGQYSEKDDKLHHRYDDAEKSEHIVVVVEGLPTELGVIELSSKDKE